MIALASPWGLVLIVLALIGLAALAVVVVSGSRRRPAWRVLRDPAAADAVERMRSGAARARPAPPVAPAAVAPPARSEALSLLAVLQQEARLVDFLKEPLDGYTDAQVGAAVRDVHRDGATALERLFAIRPLRREAEGSDVSVPAGVAPPAPTPPPVPQPGGPGTVEPRPVLPSYLYAGTAEEAAAGTLDLPWAQRRDWAVGAFARRQAADVPARTVAATKSWLAYPRVDRR